MIPTINNSTFQVSGKVMQKSVYCGGAKPPQELLDRLSIPVAYPDKTFYIREGNINETKAKVVTKFVTQADGTFSIQLKPGLYAVIQEEQLTAIDIKTYENNNQKIDKKCLAEWWKKPLYLLEVRNEDITDLEFLFDRRCFIKSDIPCISYTGPRPQ